jgi:DNA-directed RNA polymerase alpha subunit
MPRPHGGFRADAASATLPARSRISSEPNILDPTPELPDDTPIENVRFSTRNRNALTTAGVKTVGEIREASDAMLLSLRDLGKGSVAHLRETLGLPSTDGVRPLGKKPT